MTALEDTTNKTLDTQQNITGNLIATVKILNESIILKRK
jgi:DNA-binding MltR family transcriptional regulator